MARALSFLGAHGSLLLFFWFLLQAAQVGASPQALTKRVPGQFPSFPADYEGRIKKGAYLASLLSLTDEEATQKNGGNAVASPWQNQADVERWGWRRDPIKWGPWRPKELGSNEYGDDIDAFAPPSGGPGYGRSLDEAFDDPDHLVEDEGNGVVAYVHANNFRTSAGKPRFPTGGNYRNVVNPLSGTVIFDQNFSPRYEIEISTMGGGVPELENVSDLAFFQWWEACTVKGVDPKTISQFFRAHIVTPATFAIVVEALKEAQYTEIPTWKNRAVFSLGSRAGQAMLGTLHGAGVAMFLLQHKEHLGVKTISEVAVWTSYSPTMFTAVPGYVNLNMRFIVADV